MLVAGKWKDEIKRLTHTVVTTLWHRWMYGNMDKEEEE